MKLRTKLMSWAGHVEPFFAPVAPPKVDEDQEFVPVGGGSGNPEPSPKKRRDRSARGRKETAVAEMAVSHMDTRHDKYLHSHARRRRREWWKENHKGLGYPFDGKGVQ
jgi:hypothetical protein